MLVRRFDYGGGLHVAYSVEPWERRTANAVQVVLYLLLFLMPLSGRADAAARGLTLTALGMALLPSIAHPRWDIFLRNAPQFLRIA